MRAGIAQILGNNVSVEPYTKKLYVRRVLSGGLVRLRHSLRHSLEG